MSRIEADVGDRVVRMLVDANVRHEEICFILDVAREGLRLQRMFDLVNAKGSVVEPAKLSRGKVVVVDGRTGLDACEDSAERGIESLLDEADGHGSPSRLFFGIVGGLPYMALRPAPDPQEIRKAIEAAS